MTSLELVEQIRAGRNAREAEDELYRRASSALVPRLAAKIPGHLRSRIDAEDVLQTAFLRALKALEKFVPTSEHSFYAWVYTIAKHIILDTAKRHSAMAVPFARDMEDAGPRESQIASPRGRATTEFMRHEQIEFLLGQLKPMEAEVIRLRFLQGLSFEAIAEKWKKAAGAVQRFYSRAFKHLEEIARERPMPEE